MKKLILFYFVLLTVSLPATAQIVNTESARMQSDTVGWMGGLGLAMTLAKNPEKIFGLDAEARLQYKTSNNRGLWLILTSYGFLRTGEDEHISNAFMHLRYNRKVTDWLRWEVFTQYQNNAITQIDSRFLLGTGPRFKIIKTKFFRLYAATLFMFEREKEKTIPIITHNDWRNSNYISLSWFPNENVEFITTTYLQPLLKKLSDYRISNHISCKVKASPHFALSVKWDYLHDRSPAGAAPRTTYSFSTGINYDF